MLSLSTSFDSIMHHQSKSNPQITQKKRNEYALNAFQKNNWDFEAAHIESGICLEFRNFDMLMKLRSTTVRFSGWAISKAAR